MRWVAELANFNFKIKYRPGKVSQDCDFLSRPTSSIETLVNQCTEDLDFATIAAVLRSDVAEGGVTSMSIHASIDHIALSISPPQPKIKWQELQKY